MNFFEAQDRTRRNTRRLLWVFALATLTIVAAVTAVLEGSLFLTGVTQGALPFSEPFRAAMVALTVLGFIVLASTFRITQLSAGGARVAQEMGGTLVNTDSPDLARQRLRNVVEEMAIASGVPVPQIFVMEEESSINAFAAGFTTADAAVAVTRGALEHLTRDELQGVIAHEFSHILNGDMRLNIRLMGVLFGIIAIGQIGRLIVRGSSGRRRVVVSSGGKNSGNSLVFVGLALIILGAIGVFFARLIRAGVSRQREYLADASAVQFTRQTDGIAGALAKIAGIGVGSRIATVDSEEVSHMLIARGARKAWLNALSSHPPLEARIKALDASLLPHAGLGETEQSMPEPGLVSALAAGGHAPIDAKTMASLAGNPGVTEMALAAAIRGSLPASVYDASHSREWAFYLTLALALTENGYERDQQLAILQSRIGEQRCERIRQYADTCDELGARYQLPILELCFPALKERPAGQLQFLMQLIDAIHEALAEPGLHEYAFRHILLHSLEASMNPGRDSRFRTTHLGKKKTARAAEELIWIVARHGHAELDAVERAAEAGIKELGLSKTIAFDKRELAATGELLSQISGLIGHDLQKLLSGLITTISHDGRINVEESELMRLISAALNCPLPPIVDKPLLAALRDSDINRGNTSSNKLS
ncbi:MAG: M48 family metallopeptidase [Pseudomonadota bacterium]